MGGCERRWPHRSARGRTGTRPTLDLPAETEWLTGRTPGISHARGGERNRGGRLGWRWQGGDFSVERGRKTGRRDPLRCQRTVAISGIDFFRRQTSGAWRWALAAEGKADAGSDRRKPSEGRSLVTRTADGKSATQKLNKDFKSNPTTLLFHDVNQDGRADLVALVPLRRKSKCFRQGAEKASTSLTSPRPAAVVEQPWLSVADVDGDGKTGVADDPEEFSSRGGA